MKHNDSLSGATETLLFVLALAAIGACLGMLITGYTPQGLVGFALGGIGGAIVGAVAALIAGRWRGTRAKDQQASEGQHAPSLPVVMADPYLHSTRPSISDVYASDGIPVQVTLLVTYENPHPHPSPSEANPTASDSLDGGATVGLDPSTAEDVIKSLATAAARRFVHTKSIDELVDPATFDAMARSILDEMNLSLPRWWLKAHLVNVDELKLPDTVVNEQIAQHNRELAAEIDQQIEARNEAARLQARDKELQVHLDVLETSYARAKEADLKAKPASRYVLHELLTTIKEQPGTDGAWPPSLDELLSSLGDVPILKKESVDGSAN